MRRVSQLSKATEKQLCAYALLAGASGVGLTALAQPSEAEIVYTPADVTMSNQYYRSYYLDVNGDGVYDFFFGGIATEGEFFVRGLGGNAAAGFLSYGSSSCYASALRPGQLIGSRARFCASDLDLNFANLVIRDFGKWDNVSRRYLGFRFSIPGKVETHYGWARLSVRVQGNTVTAGLTGYAYETTPDKPIKAGQETGDENSSSKDVATPDQLRSNSLGALALGSAREDREMK